MRTETGLQRRLHLDGSLEGERWNALISGLPKSHLLQTWEWGQIKSRYGWQPLPVTWDVEGELYAAALVLERTLPIRIPGIHPRVMYVPKGPLLKDWGECSLRGEVLEDLERIAAARGGIFIKIDPDIRLGVGAPGDDQFEDDPLGPEVAAQLASRNWRFSHEQIQYRNTVLIDLSPDEEQLLMNMKQKTRYNVRLAGRRGVDVRIANESDLGLLYRMYAETSIRDGFAIRDEAYYRTVWGTFMRPRSPAGAQPESEQGHLPAAEGLVAEVNGEPVAGLMLFWFGGQAWYLYGMSRDKHRKKMPNYVLQWVAMQRAKLAGCKRYDLWGAPDNFDESDPMWGVYRFKEGLGGKVVRHIGAWDYPVRPLIYKLYVRLLPRVLGWMRQRGEARTRQRMEF
jgi:peptidoglycan pentaglycine glycine transferase (the first glycine)